jgi:hypothetical protein
MPRGRPMTTLMATDTVDCRATTAPVANPTARISGPLPSPYSRRFRVDRISVNLMMPAEPASIRFGGSFVSFRRSRVLFVALGSFLST